MVKSKSIQKRKRYTVNPSNASVDDHREEFLSSLPADRETEESVGYKYTPAEPLPADLAFEDDEDEDEEMDLGEEIVYEEEVGAEDDEKMAVSGKAEEVKKVWHPKFGTQADEHLEHDPRAYKVYHKLHVEWPSLSFDVYRDGLGEFRSKYPMTATIVAGSQASVSLKNKISVYKVSQVYKTKYDDDDEEEEGEDAVINDEESDDDNDGEDIDPIVEERAVRHDGSVNRIRCLPQASHIVATWSETAKVHIWDLKHVVESIQPEVNTDRAVNSAVVPETLKPLFTFKGHSMEGFAMDWSPMFGGKLVTGDCNRHIYLWEPQQGSGSWNVEKPSFSGHSASVEDLQWSPTQAEVFASCSVDRSIRIWDCRVKKNSILCVEEAHTSDVNVISWNRSASAAHLLVSGSDDGSFKVWDLRAFNAGQPAGHFKWHNAPITSIEWHPTQEAVIGVASEDDSISIWDLGLEADPEAVVEGAQIDDSIEIPPQLSFVHQGMKQVKELHFHPQIPSLIFGTTSEGFDVFKPDNL